MNTNSNSQDRNFHPLNTNEIAVIVSAVKRNKIPANDIRIQYTSRLRVSYEYMQGGFCICILVTWNEDTNIVYRGASRRSYKDPRKPIKGEMLAFSRAILYSRAVELG